MNPFDVRRPKKACPLSDQVIYSKVFEGEMLNIFKPTALLQIRCMFVSYSKAIVKSIIAPTELCTGKAEPCHAFLSSIIQSTRVCQATINQKFA